MEEMWLLCSLCGKRARMVCESDQAKLCWECDSNVHGANFVAAKHLRILLCRLCQSPTPWKACGASLTPTSSLCHPCTSLFPNHPIPTTQSPNNHHHHISDDDDDDDDDNDNDDGYDVPEEEEEEEGENQVVPWSPPFPSPNSNADADISSPATASGSGTCHLPLKRFPHNTFLHDSDDEIRCSSSEASLNDESSSMTMSMFRPVEQPRINQREAAQWHNRRW